MNGVRPCLAAAVAVLCLALPLSAARGAPPLLSVREAVQRFPLTETLTPWELLHAIVALGANASLTDTNGTRVALVDVICTQRVVETDDGARDSIAIVDGAPRFITTYGEGVVQGHRWQFAAKLLGAGVELTQPVAGRTFTSNLREMIEGMLRDIDAESLAVRTPPMSDVAYREYEVGWTIEALSGAYPGGHAWRNREGKPVRTEDLVELALSHPLGWGACGGTHELMALAAWLNSPNAAAPANLELRRRVRERFREAARLAVEQQNADGSYSLAWTGRSDEALGLATWPPIVRKLYVTGHMLAWMTLVSDAADLERPALRKAYAFVRDARVAPRHVARHFAPLAHAVEAMNLYERKAGQRK